MTAENSNAVRIVFLDAATVSPHVIIRRPAFAHDWVAYDQTAADQVVERLAGAEICILNKVQLRADALAQLPDLRMVMVAATGTDCVDIAACRERGVTVCNIRNYARHTVPEHTFALILALRRQVLRYAADVRQGAWQDAGQFCFHTHPIHDLAGSRLGIIGEGSIGQQVAALGRAFGMEVVFAAHKGVDGLGPLYTPWDEVMATSHVITLHCPLTPKTRGMIAMPEFRQMAQRPLIVNTARGHLIEENDLLAAVEAGLVSGAGIDVTLPEPPPVDSPLMRLAEHPNAIVTPHVAWASIEAQQALVDQTDRNHRAVRCRHAEICGDLIHYADRAPGARLLFSRAFSTRAGRAECEKGRLGGDEFAKRRRFVLNVLEAAAHDVGHADDPDQFAVFDHRDMAEPPVAHDPHDSLDPVAPLTGDNFARHHVADRRFHRRRASRGHCAHDVALRQDAVDRASCFTDDERPELAGGQSVGRLPQRLVGGDGHDLRPFVGQERLDGHGWSPVPSDERPTGRRKAAVRCHSRRAWPPPRYHPRPCNLG